MKTFRFSLVLRTRENTDVFISLDDNIYGIHSKRINILYALHLGRVKRRSTFEHAQNAQIQIILCSLV